MADSELYQRGWEKLKEIAYNLYIMVLIVRRLALLVTLAGLSFFDAVKKADEVAASTGLRARPRGRGYLLSSTT